MKNVIALLFCMILTNGFGQVWIDSDAKWTFDLYNAGISGTATWEYTHDTIIQGQQAQVLESTYYEYYSGNENHFHK